MSVNRLQAGICNLRVSGTLRVEFQPLMKTVPLIGAISAAFVKDPVSRTLHRIERDRKYTSFHCSVLNCADETFIVLAP